jgi:hypothetical protein
LASAVTRATALAVGDAVVASDAAFFVDEDEAGGVVETGADAAEFKDVVGDEVQDFGVAGEEVPAGGVGFEALRVLGEGFGVSRAGSTLKETSLTSAGVWFWIANMCELMRGQGPSQLVKMKSATQTWPSREGRSKGFGGFGREGEFGHLTEDGHWLFRTGREAEQSERTTEDPHYSAGRSKHHQPVNDGQINDRDEQDLARALVRAIKRNADAGVEEPDTERRGLRKDKSGRSCPAGPGRD